MRNVVKHSFSSNNFPVFITNIRKFFLRYRFFLGGYREGEIPVPIPNTEVKPFIADGTTHKSVEE